MPTSPLDRQPSTKSLCNSFLDIVNSAIVKSFSPSSRIQRSVSLTSVYFFGPRSKPVPADISNPIWSISPDQSFVLDQSHDCSCGGGGGSSKNTHKISLRRFPSASSFTYMGSIRRKNMDRRKMIIKEIMETERRYVADLEALQDARCTQLLPPKAHTNCNNLCIDLSGSVGEISGIF